MSNSTMKSRTLNVKRIESIIRRLNSADPVTCRETADELFSLPTEQIREVIEYNSSILDPGRAIIQLVVGYLVSVLFVFAVLMQALPLAAGLLLAFGSLIGFFSVRAILRAVKAGCTGCAALSRVVEPILSHLDGVSAVPLMADALFDHGPITHAVARTVLIRQLPRMESGHAALLVPAQQRKLNSILQGGDSELIIAILTAYGQIGDASALEPVARLARSAADPTVRAAADACLPLLRERAEAEEERSNRAVMGRPCCAPPAVRRLPQRRSSAPPLRPSHRHRNNGINCSGHWSTEPDRTGGNLPLPLINKEGQIARFAPFASRGK